MCRVYGVVAGVLFVAAAVAAPIPKADEKPKFDLPKELAEAREQLTKSEAGGADAAKAGTQFRAILQKIAPALAEVTPEKGEAKKYTKLTLNKDKATLDAFRFKTPDGKANWDMNWEFVTPPDTIGAWYILPREGTMTGFRRFNFFNNYQEKDANLPEKNQRIVQPLDGGVLKPGSEYVIWFTFEKAEPVEFHIRIGLTEAKPAKD